MSKITESFKKICENHQDDVKENFLTSVEGLSGYKYQSGKNAELKCDKNLD